MSLHYIFELVLTVRIIIMMISMIVPMSNMIPDHFLVASCFGISKFSKGELGILITPLS